MARLLSPADVLAVFVKAPQVGTVKTRLAGAIGARQAAKLYHRMGRQVVEQCLAPEQYRTVVWFAPATGESAVRAWLETLRVDDFIAQSEGDLEARLAATYERHFAEGVDRMVVIGSDCPGIGLPLVHQAFQALEHHDLVIGPARDGGFYLLGLNAPAPELFRHIVVIGSDCPGIGLPLVHQAYQALEHHDLVIGPARDGGFYLLGLLTAGDLSRATNPTAG